jgi:GT2 family glycosyltransferase
VDVSKRHNRAAVGSIIRDKKPPYEVLSIGPKVDYWRLAIWDLLSSDTGQCALDKGGDISVSMLSGRGTLYPVEAFARAGTMRPRVLPHYFADYEFADRVRRSDIQLIVSCSTAVYSLPEWGSNSRRFGRWARWFSKGSASNIVHALAFWMLVGSTFQRCTAVGRYILIKMISNNVRARIKKIF